MTSELNNNKKYIVNFESERLRIRNLKAEDVEGVISIWVDPDVTKYMGGPRKRNDLVEGFEEDLENPYKYEYDLWPIIEKSSDKLIGHCGLLEKEIEGRSEIEVIYVIKKEHWGNGYASEIANAFIEYAFTQKGLGRVVALIKPDNEGSEKVAHKCGMVFEKEIIRKENTKMKLYVKESAKA